MTRAAITLDELNARDEPGFVAALDGVFSPKSTNKKAAPSRLWSMLPAQLRRRRLGASSGTTPIEAPSEAPPSVRIRATPPPGIISSPPPSETSPTAAAKPLRKAPAKTTDGSKSSASSRETSSPPPAPPAPDEST